MKLAGEMFALYGGAVLLAELLYRAHRHWNARQPKRSSPLPPVLAGQDNAAVIRLNWIADMPIAVIESGDPVAVAIWLDHVREGVSIHA